MRRLQGVDELLGTGNNLRVPTSARPGMLRRAAVAVGEPGAHRVEAGEEEMGGLLDGMVLRRGRGSLVRFVGLVGVCHGGSV